MDLKMDINIEQRQELIMTPKLQMAIKLLQFSSLELEEYLDDELLENPILEKEDKKEEWEESLENYYNTRNFRKSTGSTEGQDRDSFETYTNYRPGLMEHLENQLYEVLLESELDLGKYIISNLNQDGLLIPSVEELSEETGEDPVLINKVLEKIQHLDPIGIASRTIKEALLIQLETLGEDNDLAIKIVTGCWNKLNDLSIKKLMKKYKANEEEVLFALEKIKNLQPRPALLYSNEELKTDYLEPDILIKRDNGEYYAELNSSNTPLLSINPKYYRLMKNTKDNETNEFLEKKFKAAIWLIRAIEHRRMTLLKISNVLINRQKKFLNKGVKHLKPLTMQEVAKEIEMHESTVSRASNDKYIQTPQGLYNMKFFFASGVDNRSSASIKALITEYINKENKDKPLSDNKLAEVLEENEGISLSRRTIAKYRNSLDIPSSVERKKWKQC
ncbi:MAG: RNA polymerase factor sigma-54 [Bacillota bacterium]